MAFFRQHAWPGVLAMWLRRSPCGVHSLRAGANRAIPAVPPLQQTHHDLRGNTRDVGEGQLVMYAVQETGMDGFCVEFTVLFNKHRENVTAWLA